MNKNYRNTVAHPGFSVRGTNPYDVYQPEIFVSFSEIKQKLDP